MSRRGLIFDPFAGAAGDMTIAALLDLGLPLAWLQSFVAGLGIGDIRVGAERTDRLGISCMRLLLEFPEDHAHRHLSDIVRIIDDSGVAPEVRESAVAAFTLLAEAEAEVHGTSVEAVHVHEVGALDAIVDVLGAVAGCREMGFERFYTRPVALGRGWGRMAHGNFPIPPPAVLKILEGVPVTDPPFDKECTTPTGASLIASLTGGAAPPERFIPEATGFGAGTREHEDRPNCLRLIAIREDGGQVEEVRIVQADLDDMSPEYVPPLLEDLRTAGALDAVAAPIIMKKGRPGIRIEALTAPGSEAAVSGCLLASSTTIGLRSWTAGREVLERRIDTVEWRGQRIRVKRSALPNGGERTKPEFDDVLRAARALDLPPLEVHAAVVAALRDR